MPSLKLPRIGFGTWQLSPGDCTSGVLNAVKIGYRLIDTAQLYMNEAAVGSAISQCGVPREELIIATKVGFTNLSPNKVISSVAKSLEKLKTDYVDILYVHWPIITYNAEKTLKTFCEIVDQGKVRHIGVSNFPVARMEEGIAVCQKYGKSILALQVEHHPLLKQKVLREYIAKKGIYLVAYSPIMRGGAAKVPEIGEIAKKHGISEAQVCLAWEMDHGAIPIPKATSEPHIADNFKALDLKLDKEDLARIDAIKAEKRIVNFPLIHPKWD
jgi:2,5-diketo-D-gluconate reductase B